jgi:hypothetical protein
MTWSEIALDLGLEVAKWLLGAGIMGVVVWAVARRQLSRRRFLGRVNFSYNDVEDGTLRLYTLMEKRLDEVLLRNSALRNRVLAAAGRATEDHPFLDVSEDDMQLLRIAVLNELSERYSDGIVDRAAGRPCRAVDLVFCMTFEPYGTVRVRKLRVMVVKPDVLARFGDESFCESLRVVTPVHRDRIRTLRSLHALHEREKAIGDSDHALVGVVRLWRPVGEDGPPA